ETATAAAQSECAQSRLFARSTSESDRIYEISRIDSSEIQLIPLDHRAKAADDFLQTPSNLAQRTDFDRVEQRRETILTDLHDSREFVESAFRFLSVFLFELREPIYLQLLFLTRRANELYFRSVVIAVSIFVQSNDRSRAVVDLLFIAVCGALDLAALISFFH